MGYKSHMSKSLLACAAAIAVLATPARAAQCGGDFDAFIDTFRREASAQGVPASALTALDGLAPDPKVISLDRRQGVFRQSFEQFATRRIAERLAKAQRMMQTHAALLRRIEQQYGVPGSVLIAIWGLETDFGVDIGKSSVVRSLATLAHDCRRTQMFQGELLAALQIVARGDLSLAEMRGAWAGELGQAQFLPSNYIKFAVDFDGNGRRDLIHSVADTLASIANLLKSFGWARGGGYRQGSANFAVLSNWNKSSVYQQTIAAFAERLDGG
jgi:lytic murein transglycosylase